MIGVLKEMNKKHPCYGIYKTFKIYMDLLKNLKSINKNNTNDIDISEETLIKIRTIKELEEIGDPNKIYKITIEEEKQKETLNNLDIFKNKSFANLVRLAMNNLKIKDISALSTCSFPELKKLIIGHGELDNNCIDVIKNMTLPKIKFISLYHNKISSPEIFSIPENFETLKKFYVGFNLIDINLQLDENKKYKLNKNLKQIGLTNCFTKKTNHFIIEQLDFTYIKKLFINGCQFNTLKPFEVIDFQNLKQFWARGYEEENYKEGTNDIYLTDIKEINYINKKDNIKKIVLKGNRIKNIEELINIIPKFPQLELLNLEFNGFDKEKDKEKIEKVNEELKEKGLDKVKIIYFKEDINNKKIIN